MPVLPRTIPRFEDEQHIIYYTGNGVQTFFEIIFAMDEDSIVIAVVDGVLVNNFQQQSNGIRFYTPPPMGAAIMITRVTEVSQLRDWNPFDAFEASKTELAADKLIMLKQEASALRGNLNLYTIQAIDGATIVNSAGADAFIPLWHVTSPQAGMFNGELTEQAPPDSAPVIEPTGYVWFQPGEETPPPPNAAQFSSALYPIDAFETMDSNSEVLSGQHWSIEWPNMDVSSQVIASTLVVTIKYGAFTAPPELLDSSSQVLGGSLVVTIKYGAFATPAEAMDSNSVVLNGELKIVVNYIALTAEPGLLDSASSVLDGSLITV